MKSLTTQSSPLTYMVSAFAGNSAILSRAIRWSCVCFWTSTRCFDISDILRSVSAWCSRGWLKATARDWYVISVNTDVRRGNGIQRAELHIPS